MQTTQSAGGIVLNSFQEVAVVNQNGDSWSLPKGHIDPGETAEDAATREIHEETGLTDMHLVRKVGEYERYKIGKGGAGDDEGEMKHITIFLFVTQQVALVPIDPENPTAKWVSIEQVADILTHPKDKEFFLRVKHSLK